MTDTDRWATAELALAKLALLQNYSAMLGEAQKCATNDCNLGDIVRLADDVAELVRRLYKDR